MLGNGYYLYRDWSWPLSNKVSPVLNYSPGLLTNFGTDPFGFTRVFITWPVAIIQNLTQDSILAEKIYLLYLFSIILGLAFVLADLILRTVNKYDSRPMRGFRAEAFTLAVVLLCFLNFWCLEILSAFFYTYFIEFLLFSISFTIIIYRECSLDSLLISASLLSLCIYLDPDLYLFGLVSIGIAVITSTITRRELTRSVMKSIAKVGITFLITLPSLLTMLYILQQTTGTGLRGPSDYVVYSTNLTLDNAVRLLGYWWSTIMFAPPTILWTQMTTDVHTLGSPPYLLLPPGTLSAVWILSTWSTPLIALEALRFKAFRRLTLPASVLALGSFVLVQPPIIASITRVPLNVGLGETFSGAVLTVFGIPDHPLVMLAISYGLLCSVTIYSSIRISGPTKTDNASGTHKPSTLLGRAVRAWHSLVPTLTVVLILFVLAFPSWQLFSGSFYPSGSMGAEGLSNVGAFSPGTPPPDMSRVYDWLLSQPGAFNIYWPSSNGYSYPWNPKSTSSFTVVDSPKPTITSPKFARELSFLIASNRTSDISSYLAAMNVRFLVTQPMSPYGMSLAWGIQDLDLLTRTLEQSAGIGKILTSGDVSVFENARVFGTLSALDGVFKANASDQRTPILYNIFASMGKRVALVSSSSFHGEACLDEVLCSTRVLSPDFVASTMTDQLIFSALDGSTNDSNGTGILSEGGRFVLFPWKAWTVNDWGPGSVLVASNGSSMRWTFDKGVTTVSTSYNGTITDNHPGGVSILGNLIPIIRVQFDYRTSATFDSRMQISVPILNSTLRILSVPGSQYFPSSPSWTRVSYGLTLPLGAAFFTARIQTSAASTGWVDIRNMSLQVSFVQQSVDAPFGTSFSPSRTQNLTLTGSAYFQYDGFGNVTSAKGTTSLSMTVEPKWSPEIVLLGTVSFEGNLRVRAIVLTQRPLWAVQPQAVQGETSINLVYASDVLFSRPFAPGYSLVNSQRSLTPVSTIEGLVLFENVMPGDYHLVFSSLPSIRTAYVATLTGSAIIFVGSTGIGSVVTRRMLKVTPRLHSYLSKIYQILRSAASRILRYG